MLVRGPVVHEIHEQVRGPGGERPERPLGVGPGGRPGHVGIAVAVHVLPHQGIQVLDAVLAVAARAQRVEGVVGQVVGGLPRRVVGQPGRLATGQHDRPGIPRGQAVADDLHERAAVLPVGQARLDDVETLGRPGHVRARRGIQRPAAPVRDKLPGRRGFVGQAEIAGRARLQRALSRHHRQFLHLVPVEQQAALGGREQQVQVAVRVQVHDRSGLDEIVQAVRVGRLIQAPRGGPPRLLRVADVRVIHPVPARQADQVVVAVLVHIHDERHLDRVSEKAGPGVHRRRPGRDGSRPGVFHEIERAVGPAALHVQVEVAVAVHVAEGRLAVVVVAVRFRMEDQVIVLGRRPLRARRGAGVHDPRHVPVGSFHGLAHLDVEVGIRVGVQVAEEHRLQDPARPGQVVGVREAPHRRLRRPFILVQPEQALGAFEDDEIPVAVAVQVAAGHAVAGQVQQEDPFAPDLPGRLRGLPDVHEMIHPAARLPDDGIEVAVPVQVRQLRGKRCKEVRGGDPELLRDGGRPPGLGRRSRVGPQQPEGIGAPGGKGLVAGHEIEVPVVVQVRRPRRRVPVVGNGTREIGAGRTPGCRRGGPDIGMNQDVAIRVADEEILIPVAVHVRQGRGAERSHIHPPVREDRRGPHGIARRALVLKIVQHAEQLPRDQVEVAVRVQVRQGRRVVGVPRQAADQRRGRPGRRPRGADVLIVHQLVPASDERVQVAVRVQVAQRGLAQPSPSGIRAGQVSPVHVAVQHRLPVRVAQNVDHVREYEPVGRGQRPVRADPHDIRQPSLPGGPDLVRKIGAPRGHQGA